MLVPALHGEGLLVLWGNIDTTTVNEDALNEWWTNEHLPERLRLPGFIRARRYCGPLRNDRSRAYFACYEVSKLEHLRSESYMESLNSPTPNTEQFMPALAKMNRSACSIICSTSRMYHPRFARGLSGNWMASIVFIIPHSEPESEQVLNTRISDAFLPRAITLPGVSSFNLAREDDLTTQIGSTSKSYAGVQFEEGDKSARRDNKRYTALIEFSVPVMPGDSKPSIVQNTVESFIEQIMTLGATGVTWDAYQLLCSMGPNVINDP
ncbi:hypothetical protein K505DRAFT_322521 [Melanomma pulvis-pyrius CBS 109.77]|uniref:Uncharacterized protein n=1 Tax=Melanomma pulvis-pyrius CBS 109.77 TaxID=1314802 RepID=A0A6A6XM97_9PLEO|nr:hypothetical protein K505DRAFT_322521 [Melanomma pulvis-pyrius CBS 109.77]